MTNLNPHGNRKEISREVKREIKPFEQNYLNSFWNKGEVSKIYEVEDSSWNLFLLDNEYFLSIPKIENSCGASIFGSVQHTEKYHELINL